MGRNVIWGEMLRGEMSWGEMLRGELSFGVKCYRAAHSPRGAHQVPQFLLLRKPKGSRTSGGLIGKVPQGSSRFPKVPQFQSHVNQLKSHIGQFKSHVTQVKSHKG